MSEPHYKRSIHWMLEYEKPKHCKSVLIAGRKVDTMIAYWDDEDGFWKHAEHCTPIEAPDYWFHLPALPMDPEDEP